MQTLWARCRNLWFLSGISKEEMLANPHTFIQRAINVQEQLQGYIIGLSDEEQSFKDSLNVDNKDTKLV